MKKRVLGLVLAFCLLPVVFAGCGSQGETASTGEAETAVVRMNIGSEPDSLDPWQSAATDTEAIFHNVFEWLCSFDETGASVPGLAPRW